MTAEPSAADVATFRALVARQLGLHIDDHRVGEAVAVLRARAKSAAGGSVHAYLQRLTSGDRPELAAVAEELTVPETYFFRYPEQARVLSDYVLERHAARPEERRLRLLSAGAASGEEGYSVAIGLREALGPAHGWDIGILGVDVNRRAIARARKARYSAWSLRETPPSVRARYFVGEGTTFELEPSIRAMVSFEERNLLDDDPLVWPAEALDVVLCRNVLIYFTPEATRTLVDRIARSLRFGGLLLLGHAETLRNVSQDFDLGQAHGVFYYRRRAAPVGAGGRPPSALEEARRAAADPLESRDATAAAVPEPPGDAAWVGVIERSSERIAELTDRRRASPKDGAQGGGSRLAADPYVVMSMLEQERFDELMTLLGPRDGGTPEDPETALVRAVVLTNRGQHAEAEAACRDLLGVGSIAPGAHYLMALCREQVGDRDAALEHDRQATYLLPDFAMPRLHEGLLERRAGRLEQARTALGRALELLPIESASSIVLFGGGFRRGALVELCRTELRRCGGRA